MDPIVPDDLSEKDEEETEPEVEDAEPAEDGPEVEEVDLDVDDMGGEDLFADVEDASTSSGGETDETDSLGELDGGSAGLAGTINEGAARLSVVGLDDDEREDLETEMQDVFEAFQLGRFGTRFMDEYVLIGDAEEIDPAWGLLGSAVCCASVALWMRPDSDEKIEALGDAVQNLSGAAL